MEPGSGHGPRTRQRLEQRYHLRPIELEEGSTFSYALMDTRSVNVRNLVASAVALGVAWGDRRTRAAATTSGYPLRRRSALTLIQKRFGQSVHVEQVMVEATRVQVDWVKWQLLEKPLRTRVMEPFAVDSLR